MRTITTKLCSILAVVVVGLGAETTSLADSALAKIIPPGSVPFGRTYAEWQAAWWQWCTSIPVGPSGSGHPLFSGTDASIGQTGPVFFLGAAFASGTTPTVRNITVPEGKAFFFPIVNEINLATSVN